MEHADISKFNQEEKEMMTELVDKKVNVKTQMMLYRHLSGTLEPKRESVFTQGILEDFKKKVIKSVRSRMRPAEIQRTPVSNEKLEKRLTELNAKYEKLLAEKKRFGMRVETEVRKRLRNVKSEK